MVVPLKFWFTILIWMVIGHAAYSQNRDTNIVLHVVDGDPELLKNYRFDISPSPTTDSLTIRYKLNLALNSLREDGFLLANLDSLYIEKHSIEAWIYIGRKFEKARLSLKLGSADIEEWPDIERYNWNETEVSLADIDSFLKLVIEFSENRGYPFAKIEWEDVKILGNELKAVAIYNPGPYIVFDSLEISGNLMIENTFLGAHLGIIKGKAFNQDILEMIPDRLDQLNFLIMDESPLLSFQNEEATISLSLNKRRSSRFDAIIGFLPNEKAGENILITGAIDLELRNLFRSGKTLEFHWSNFQVASQSLNINYAHPNIFKSPIGLDVDFSLYKQDTTFINRGFLAGIDFRVGGFGRGNFFSRWEASRLIEFNFGLNPTELPPLSDYNISYLGFGYTNLPYSGLNYGSTNRMRLTFDISLGNKIIHENSNFDEQLYDDIELKSTQFSGTMELEGIIPFKNNPFAIYIRMGAGIVANSQLFLNDLYRLGGLNTIRGFNENNFYASDYIIGSIEFQAYFSDLSRIFLFYDQSYLNYNVQNIDYSDSPLGLGLGISLETTGGIFSFIYAVGKSEEQSLSLRFSKIHFGYLAVF